MVRSTYVGHVVLLVNTVVQRTERTTVRVQSHLFAGVVRIWRKRQRLAFRLAFRCLGGQEEEDKREGETFKKISQKHTFEIDGRVLLVGVLGQVGLFGSIQTNFLVARSGGVHEGGERFVRESLLVAGDAENVVTTVRVAGDRQTVRMVGGHHDQSLVLVQHR